MVWVLWFRDLWFRVLWFRVLWFGFLWFRVLGCERVVKLLLLLGRGAATPFACRKTWETWATAVLSILGPWGGGGRAPQGSRRQAAVGACETYHNAAGKVPQNGMSRHRPPGAPHSGGAKYQGRATSRGAKLPPKGRRPPPGGGTVFTFFLSDGTPEHECLAGSSLRTQGDGFGFASSERW